MLPEYRTIYRGGEDEIIEKKSRFIATVVPVNTEEEALEFVEKTRKKYWDARHNCFAYIIGERGQLQRCSDDGEPNGTAGKPMLDVLLGNELRNVAVVVTRYFGGILLGSGGLVRAYSSAASLAMKAARAARIMTAKRYRVRLEYPQLARFQQILAQLGGSQEDESYAVNVELTAVVPQDDCARFEERVREAFNAAVVPAPIDMVNIPVPLA